MLHMLNSCSSCCNKLTILTLAHSLGPFILSFCFSHPYFPLFASVFLFIFNYSCPISIPNACTHPFLCLFCQKRCTSRDLYFELICVYFDLSLLYASFMIFSAFFFLLLAPVFFLRALGIWNFSFLFFNLAKTFLTRICQF